jgi:hypothetical protein
LFQMRSSIVSIFEFLITSSTTPKRIANKSHHPTARTRPVSMILRKHNINNVLHANLRS